MKRPATIRRRATLMHNSGLTVLQIARELELPRSTVYLYIYGYMGNWSDKLAAHHRQQDSERAYREFLAEARRK